MGSRIKRTAVECNKYFLVITVVVAFVSYCDFIFVILVIAILLVIVILLEYFVVIIGLYSMPFYSGTSFNRTLAIST